MTYILKQNYYFEMTINKMKEIDENDNLIKLRLHLFAVSLENIFQKIYFRTKIFFDVWLQHYKIINEKKRH